MKYLIIILLFASFGARAQPWKAYAPDFRHFHYIWADTLKQTYNLAYNATTWNGNLGIPTMDAVRDKIESLGSGSVYSIDKQYTNVQNSGSSATDMFSKTVAANQLSADGNMLQFETSGFEVDATATMNLGIYFNGTSIGSTGALTLAGTTNWVIRGTIIRTSSSTMRSDLTISVDDGTTRNTYINSAVMSSLDFTSTIVLKLVGTAGGGGASTGDIIGHLWFVDFKQ